MALRAGEVSLNLTENFYVIKLTFEMHFVERSYTNGEKMQLAYMKSFCVF